MKKITSNFQLNVTSCSAQGRHLSGGVLVFGAYSGLSSSPGHICSLDKRFTVGQRVYAMLGSRSCCALC